jgi:hypothetical protein
MAAEARKAGQRIPQPQFDSPSFSCGIATWTGCRERKESKRISISDWAGTWDVISLGFATEGFKTHIGKPA